NSETFRLEDPAFSTSTSRVMAEPTPEKGHKKARKDTKSGSQEPSPWPNQEALMAVLLFVSFRVFCGHSFLRLTRPGECLAHDHLRLVHDGVQVRLVLEALGVDLVEVLRPR